jgi:hypothetical protein
LQDLNDRHSQHPRGGLRAKRRLVGNLALMMIAFGLAGVALIFWAMEGKAPQPCRWTVPVGLETELCLVCPDEIQEMERQLLAQLSRQQEMDCRRPVLRGQPLPGSARYEMERLFLAANEQMSRRLELFRSDDADHLSEFLEGNRPGDEAVEQVAAAFEGLAPVVARAVGHEDACGVYLQGTPATLRSIRLFKGLSILLRVWSEQGREGDALDLGLQLIRLSQDLVRGEGASLGMAMARVGLMEWVALHAIRLGLNEGALPPTTQLKRAEREASLLLQTEPGFGSVLVFDERMFSFNVWLPCVRGNQWVPPKRFLSYADPTMREILEPKDYYAEDRWTHGALNWLASNLRAEAFARACPPDANGLECKAGLQRELEREASKLAPLTVLGALLGEEPFVQVRNAFVGRYFGVAFFRTYQRYARLWACNSFLVAAVRLQLHLLYHAGETGRCPSAEELGSEEWAAFVTDPNAGVPMQIAIEQDRYTVGTAPFPIEEGIEADYCDKPYVIRCRYAHYSP